MHEFEIYKNKMECVILSCLDPGQPRRDIEQLLQGVSYSVVSELSHWLILVATYFVTLVFIYLIVYLLVLYSCFNKIYYFFKVVSFIAIIIIIIIDRFSAWFGINSLTSQNLVKYLTIKNY